jgi:hypothetical protein
VGNINEFINAIEYMKIENVIMIAGRKWIRMSVEILNHVSKFCEV